MENLSRHIGTGHVGGLSRPNATHGQASENSGGRILLAGQSEPAAARYRLFWAARITDLIRVRSVEEIVSLVSSGSVDLILMDSSLHDLGAIELCRVLKRSPATQLLPAFVLWSQRDLDAEARAIEAGADAFLPLDGPA